MIEKENSDHIGFINEIFTPWCIGDETSSFTSPSLAMWQREGYNMKSSSGLNCMSDDCGQSYNIRKFILYEKINSVINGGEKCLLYTDLKCEAVI